MRCASGWPGPAPLQGGDVVGLDDAAFVAPADLDVWIVDALRLKPLNVRRQVSAVRRLRVRRETALNPYVAQISIEQNEESLPDRFPIHDSPCCSPPMFR